MLVAAVCRSSAPDATEWFTTHGRAFRNGIAHGSWTGALEDELRHVFTLLRGVVPMFIDTWVATTDRVNEQPRMRMIAAAEQLLPSSTLLPRASQAAHQPPSRSA
jgi:hypothetical protein